MACKGQDQACLWFALANVEYDEAHCQLDSNIHEIKVLIRGQRNTGRGNSHSFELMLSEQGKPFCIEIAQKPINSQATGRSVAFSRGKYKKTGSIKSDQTLDVTFLIKKAASCP